jgi:HAE1 family hydrophobic/amphiphilic exporter-1
MKLSALPVRRGVTFGMVYLIILGVGLFSLSRLRLELNPDISMPQVMVITNYTGASPEDIETLITRPIEGAVSSAKDAKEIISNSKQGISIVEVKFEWDKDMELAETDVRRKLELVKGYLPDDATEPMVFAFDTSLQPITMMNLTGPYPLQELRRIAEDEIQPRIERLPGIASTMVDGGLVREIHVELDPLKIEAYGLDVNAVIGAVYAENTQMPGGSIQQGTLDFTIQARGKYQTVDDIGEVLVGIKTGDFGPVPLRLKDVAQVKDSFFESQRILESDGEPAVFLLVQKRSGANTVRAAEAVMNALPEIKKEVAAEIDFDIIFNQAEFVKLALGNLSTTAMIGVLISFLVLWFFLRNVRSALVVASAIPLSVIATFSVMDAADMTLNMFSMAGLALAIGLLVDNSIVVLENIFRMREEGENAWMASINGANTVGVAVIASTLTTISVFVPILFVPGIAGVMFEDMAVTICFSLAVSLIVALTFIPLASSRLLASARATRLLEKAQKRDMFARIRRKYGVVLGWSLKHRWVVGTGLAGLIFMTVVIASALPTEFVNQMDDGQVFINVETPIGNNLDETYKIIKEVEKIAAEVVRPEERKLVMIDVGVGKGFVSLWGKGVHAGLVRTPLVSMGERERSMKEIEQALAEALKDIPGAKITVKNPFNPFTGGGDIEIQIRGHNLDMSRTVGLDLKDKLHALPEMSTVNFSMDDQKPEVKITYDRPKMAQLGIPAVSVSNAVSAYFMGTMAGRFTEGGNEYDILVRYGKENRLDVDRVRKMPVVTRAGAVVPLENIAKVEIGLGPVDISRLDQGRITKLMCFLKDNYVDKDGKKQRKDLGASIKRVREMLKNYVLPKNFTYHVGGTAEDFETSFGYLGLALAVSVLLVFMVMASLFESFRQPFIIIFTVPLAAIGVVLMFSLTRSSMDVASMIGIIMLIGIVVNNGIVMVDAANQFRLQSLGRRDAILKAAMVRMRPVLMTSFTTILAMTPLALEIGEGSEGWGGMAKAVIGGLITATFLTLFVVPTFYTYFASKKPPKRHRFEGTVSSKASGGQA